MKYISICLFLLINLVATSQVKQSDAEKAGLRFIHNQAQSFEKYSNQHYSIKNTYAYNDNIWVVNLSPEGFVILANSRKTQAILAYSFNQECKKLDQSPGFDVFMNNYSKQISYANHIDYKNDKASKQWNYLLSETFIKTKEPGDGILPLLHTTWDQGVYYNAECPADGSGPANHVVTGCVATTIAQLINYFRHPLQGEGTYGYSHEDYGWLEVNFDEQNYDYNQMPIELNESNYEVAHLMYNIGVSVDMNYGPSGSGMWNHKGAYTLYTYFGYNNNTTYLFRDSLPENFDWAGMLIDHLDQKIPLYYAGWSDYDFIMGHAFIVDGYQDSTYFHINWGWGGYSDGYFSINDLTPGSSDFTLLHEAIANAVPDGIYPYGCNGQQILTSYSGTIDDGSGPLHKYNNDLNCEWLIIPEDSASGFELEFLELELDDNDVVTIFDGPSDTSPVIDSYTSNSIPPIITTTADRILIRFETNSDSVAGGFLLSYSGIKPDYCNLMNTITDATGTITDGSNQYQYQNNTFCNWYIQPENAASITVEFTEFNLESVNDYVKIVNSSNQSVTTLSGNTIPDPITIQGDKITFTFRSDEQIRAGGFSINYTTQFVGINKNLSANISIFPNPASDVLYVDVPNNQANASLNIIDTTGRIVLSQTLMGKHSSINLKALGSGYYIVKIPEMDVSQTLIIQN